jgi:hypothetical protein
MNDSKYVYLRVHRPWSRTSLIPKSNLLRLSCILAMLDRSGRETRWTRAGIFTNTAVQGGSRLRQRRRRWPDGGPRLPKKLSPNYLDVRDGSAYVRVWGPDPVLETRVDGLLHEEAKLTGYCHLRAFSRESRLSNAVVFTVLSTHYEVSVLKISPNDTWEESVTPYIWS